MKALGCFNDRMGDRLFPELLDNHRDPINGHVGFTIDWGNYQQSLDEYVKFLISYETNSYFKSFLCNSASQISFAKAPDKKRNYFHINKTYSITTVQVHLFSGVIRIPTITWCTPRGGHPTT